MRIGLLGGTFNPVHNGHLALAEGALTEIPLGRVVWIPAAANPLKPVEGKVSAEDRYRMIQLAIEGNPAFTVSRAEIDRPPPSYSVDTVQQLQAQTPGRHEWFFLLGLDAAQGLGTWRQIDRLRQLVTFAAVPRPGSNAADPPAGLKILHVQTPDISSSEIRRKIQKGESVRGLVPESVRTYIESKGLYR
ncbi:MAG: nicotinate-nucleotide adenylyltransferase [Candidatus Omnitrophica bacterium]|nr:nicotinate-nucleotide adenylyltransferase [Candidatus Omnitrophota bacterium]